MTHKSFIVKEKLLECKILILKKKNNKVQSLKFYATDVHIYIYIYTFIILPCE